VWANYPAKLERLTWKQGDRDVMEGWPAGAIFSSSIFLLAFL
jgi:hypothetical protein